jgi:hypothetical protein
MIGTQVEAGDAKPFDVISVQCTITLPKLDPSSVEVLEFCKSLLEAELRRQLGNAAA